jgi:outer membrane biosynthesis protein TonB
MTKSLLVALLLGLWVLVAGCASSKGNAKGGGGAATAGGGEAAATGDDSAYLASVEEKVEARMDAVQECFDKTQAREKTLSGKVSYEWTIRSDGKVDVVEVKSSTMNNGIVEECIKRVINDWSFPTPPRDNFTVSHSFVFAEKGK